MDSDMMSASDLDAQTRETLEFSLAMDAIRLFAVIALADNVVTEQEKDYVAEFYARFYPENIVRHFYRRFEQYLAQGIDVDDVAPSINRRLTYQEKVFYLLKAYELLLSDEAEEVELRKARQLARALHMEAEVPFIENILAIRKATPEELDQASIIGVRVSGSDQDADVYLPAHPDLELEFYKMRNIYCVRKMTDKGQVEVEGQRLRKGMVYRIPHNAEIASPDYLFSYQDLRIYFENAANPVEKSFFLSVAENRPVFEDTLTPASLATFTAKGAWLWAMPIEPHTRMTLNGEPVSKKTQINLGDELNISGIAVSPRELYTHLLGRRTLDLDKSKTTWTLSNDPRSDLHLTDDLSEMWTATLERENDELILKTGDCPYQMYLNRRPVEKEARIRPGETLYVNNVFLSFDVLGSTVEKSVFNFKKIVADTLKYQFLNGAVGLDDVTFDFAAGDMVCIMGPSGCGKSTLLNILSGLNDPTRGNVVLDTHDLHHEYETMKDYLGYVPQDDLLLPNLTVYENLYYYARLRFPSKTRAELDAQIELVLNDIGLRAKRDTKVGQATDKTLSGGERKRLNIGMELLVNAEIFILDEPTSGLSSKDSEKILDLLANIAARGKIVLSVIHQPSSRLYKKFNKIILLDKGGRLAFRGSTFSALKYFKSHLEGLDPDDPDEPVEVVCPHCKTVQPDLLLDSLEEALRDIDGTVLGERKYSPTYWKERYQVRAQAEHSGAVAGDAAKELPPVQPMTIPDRFRQFSTLFSRNLKNKTRDRSNLLITFLEAPLLGAGVGFVLRYSPSGDYTLFANEVYKVFLFIAIIVAIFLSMTNSVDEVIGDAPLFLRERMLNVKKLSYLGAKLLVLFPFAIVQNVLFILLGFMFLEVRELQLQHIAFLSLVSLAGISMGLLISSLPRISSKAAQNIVPLVLVPQIILGGALIKFEEMNESFTFYKDSPVPEFCQLMPSRWAYEGLMVLQEDFNSYDGEHMRLVEARNDFKYRHKEIKAANGTEYYEARRDELDMELENFRDKYRDRYGNDAIHKAVEGGEKMLEDKPTGYPMFVRRKVLPFTHIEVSTVVYNALVLGFLVLVLNSITLALLAHRERLLISVRRWRVLFSRPKRT